MSYAKKYTSNFATKNNDTLTIELWEDGYVGSPIQYPCDSYSKQYIPEGDDVFEPIYASQIAVVLDVTEDTANMPDFTAMDDRKYWAKVFRGSNLDWQGWVLSDNVQYNFDGDIKQISFNAVCGLGMLADIDYTTSVTTFRIQLLQVLQDCLIPLNFPTQPILKSSVSIYSSTMFNRIDNPNSEPWFQTWMSRNNFIKAKVDEQGITRNEYSCLDVLRDILISWGCRIFMANGEWNIIQLNQQNEATRYWTKYSLTTGYLSDGNDTGVATVEAGGSHYFVQGDQLKILKKGFNNFISDKQIEYPENMLYNADLKLCTGNDADQWVETTSGTGYVAIRANIDKNINAFILALGNVLAGSLAQIDSETPMPITVGDFPKVQFRLYFTSLDTDISGNLHPTCNIKLIIAGDTVSYYLTDDNEWDVFTIGVTNYYKVDGKEAGTLINLEEIPQVPISGTMTFGVFINGSIDTQSAIVIGDFEVTVDSEFVGVLMTAKINDTNSYRKDIVFPHGYNNNVITSQNQSIRPAFLGAVTDEDGIPMYGWYMQERFGTDNYFSLAQLMFQNYINMLRKNIINIDASIAGLLDATSVVEFADTDPTQINVSSKKYIIGSTTFDTQQNEVIGTMLQIDNTHQEATVTVTYDNGVGIGIELKMSNAGALTSGAACAFTTYPLTVYAAQFIPVIGDVIYTDIDLSNPFAGGTVWFKVFIPYYNTTRSYRINNSGVIIDSATC